MYDFGYQKERPGNGYTVWRLSPHTGDKRDCLGWVRDRRAAERLIAKHRPGTLMDCIETITLESGE